MQFIPSDDLPATEYQTCKEIFARPVIIYSDEIQRLDHIEQNDDFKQYLQGVSQYLKPEAIGKLNEIKTNDVLTQMVKYSMINGLIDCKEKLQRFMPQIYNEYQNDDLIKDEINKIFEILQNNKPQQY